MSGKKILNRIEHHLLSMQMDDSEPLFVLYSDTIRDIKNATLEKVLESLVKLIELDYSICEQKKWGKWRLCTDITVEKLQKRFEGLSEIKKRQYPEYKNEYYFKITSKGREEEVKDIYIDYYE
jgi:hypothetical protein